MISALKKFKTMLVLLSTVGSDTHTDRCATVGFYIDTIEERRSKNGF